MTFSGRDLKLPSISKNCFSSGGTQLIIKPAKGEPGSGTINGPLLFQQDKPHEQYWNNHLFFHSCYYTYFKQLNTTVRERLTSNAFSKLWKAIMSSSCKASTKLISKRPSSLNMPTRLSPSRLPTISTRPSPISVPSKIIHDGDLKKKKLSHSPSWNVAEDVNSLPEVPFLHVPSTTYAIVGEENPRTVAMRIADAVAALSSIGNYNDEKVSFKV